MKWHMHSVCRAAEQLVWKDIEGAMSDLEKVTKQAYAMVAFLAWAKGRNISFYDSPDKWIFNFTKPYSEKTAELMIRKLKR